MEAKKFDKFSSLSGGARAKEIFVLIFCGALVGFVNGFFGGGGGMICVPLCEKVLKLSAKSAHATALFVIFPISFVSAFFYALNGHLNLQIFAYVSSGVFVGGILGAFLLKLMPEKFVKIVFVAIMIFGGIRMIFGGIK